MKKNSGKQAVINYIDQHPGCSFQNIRRGTGLDSSVINSSLLQMNRDGQVKREGECRSYRYTPIDTKAVTENSLRASVCNRGPHRQHFFRWTDKPANDYRRAH
ncbi:MarR family transcriptional regulator [Klebsiella quasipneumoniae]|uniref:MarR family transcriptional regulator n=1 Tax=Klebsiella quasipneumoniae TaxID=1463165 RepID=UPI001D180CA1|nr:MarR family transcriptional regulator [Klebsiella quasipneumoniae]